jgi:hypothetical protein
MLLSRVLVLISCFLFPALMTFTRTETTGGVRGLCGWYPQEYCQRADPALRAGGSSLLAECGAAPPCLRRDRAVAQCHSRRPGARELCKRGLRSCVGHFEQCQPVAWKDSIPLQTILYRVFDSVRVRIVVELSALQQRSLKSVSDALYKHALSVLTIFFVLLCLALRSDSPPGLCLCYRMMPSPPPRRLPPTA